MNITFFSFVAQFAPILFLFAKISLKLGSKIKLYLNWHIFPFISSQLYMQFQRTTIYTYNFKSILIKHFSYKCLLSYVHSLGLNLNVFILRSCPFRMIQSSRLLQFSMSSSTIKPSSSFFGVGG